MEELIQQAKVQAVNLREVWLTGNVNQRQELAGTSFLRVCTSLAN